MVKVKTEPKIKMEPVKRSLPMKKPKMVKTKAPAKRAKMRSGGSGGKSGGKEGILVALAELKAVGMHAPSRTLVAQMAKYTGAEQAGFKKTLSQMSQAGLVEYGSNSTLEITARGESQVPSNLDPPRTNADIHVRIKAMLPPKAACIFDVLADGDAHTRLEIAKATGYPNDKTAGFKKMLSSVGGLGFLEYPSSTTAQLKDTAFPFGREGGGAPASPKKCAAKAVKKEAVKKEAVKKEVVKKEPPAEARATAGAKSPPNLPVAVSAGDDEDGNDDPDDEVYEDAMQELEEEDVDEENENDNDDEEQEEDDDDEDQNDSESEWEG